MHRTWCIDFQIPNYNKVEKSFGKIEMHMENKQHQRLKVAQNVSFFCFFVLSKHKQQFGTANLLLQNVNRKSVPVNNTRIST